MGDRLCRISIVCIQNLRGIPRASFSQIRLIIKTLAAFPVWNLEYTGNRKRISCLSELCTSDRANLYSLLTISLLRAMLTLV